MTCKNGHNSLRYKNGNCIACSGERNRRRWIEDKEALRARHAKWIAANHESIKAKNRALHAENKEAKRAKNAANYAKHAEARRAYAAAYRLAHPGFAENNNEKWYANNRERALEYARQRGINNPQAIRANRHNRRARQIAAPGKHTAADIREIAAAQRHKCAYCRVAIRKGWHLDHIMPLKLGGTNDRANLQLTCASCNHRKSAKHPIAFAQQIGRLL